MSYQSGYLYKKNGSWHVRYRVQEIQGDGSVKKVQRSHCLLPDSAHREAAMVEKHLFMSSINMRQKAPVSTMPLGEFAESYYFPWLKQEREDSTYHGYMNIWRKHVKHRVAWGLHEFQTWHGQQMLQSIAKEFQLSKQSLKNIKTLLSGIFTYAKRQGMLHGVNPMQGVEIPKAALRPAETYACDIQEILHYIFQLRQEARWAAERGDTRRKYRFLRAAAAVALGGLAGLSKGEIAGLKKNDVDGEGVHIRRAVWEGIVKDVKTRAREAAVPLIELVIACVTDCVADQHANRDPESWLIESDTGTIINMNNLEKRTVIPALKHGKMAWHGWHALRRGLATNLRELGVDPKVIQAVLRHAQLSVTMEKYIHSREKDKVQAMDRLQEAVNGVAQAEGCATSATKPKLDNVIKFHKIK